MHAKGVVIFDMGHHLTSQSKASFQNNLTGITFPKLHINAMFIVLAYRYPKEVDFCKYRALCNGSDIYGGKCKKKNPQIYIYIYRDNLKSPRRGNGRVFTCMGEIGV